MNKKFDLIKGENKNDIHNLQDLEKNKLEIKLINVQIDNEGKILEDIKSHKGSISDFIFSISGGTIAIGSIIGGSLISIASLSIITFAVGILGGLYMVVKNLYNIYEENNKYQDTKNNLIKDLNIKELINFEIKDFLKKNST